MIKGPTCVLLWLVAVGQYGLLVWESLKTRRSFSIFVRFSEDNLVSLALEDRRASRTALSCVTATAMLPRLSSESIGILWEVVQMNVEVFEEALLMPCIEGTVEALPKTSPHWPEVCCLCSMVF